MTNKILEVDNLTKEFGKTVAVDEVNFSINSGDMLNVVGENGAGKTTLIKMLGGEHTPTKGNIYYKGSKVNWNTPAQALNNGIGIIHQHPQLVDSFTAAENIYLGKEVVNKKLINDKKIYDKTNELLKEYPVTENFDMHKKVKEMTAGEKHIVEILKVLSYEPEVLIFDEPTASLPREETEALLELIKYLNKERKMTVIFISHKLEEGLDLCNKVIVLRSGKNVDFLRKDELDMDRIIKGMINEDMTEFYPDKNTEFGETILEVKGLETSYIKDIDIEIKEGEIVGLYGIKGAGMAEVMEAIFGLKQLKSGEIKFSNNQVIKKPTIKMMKNLGIYYIPGDRHSLGLFPTFKVRENITIAHLYDLFSNKILIDRNKERSLTKKQAKELKIKYSSPDQNIQGLSGGNQQKVVVGRWLLGEANILLLNNPTMGIDIRAKKDMYEILKELTKLGKSVIFVSTDINEIIGVSNRIYTMKSGKKTGELKSHEISKEAILKKIL